MFTTTTHALDKFYMLANQYKPKTTKEVMQLSQLFERIWHEVKIFQDQCRPLQEEWQELNKITEDTSKKQSVRDEAQKRIDELDEQYVAIHQATVSIDLPAELIGLMVKVIEDALEQWAIVGRLPIKVIGILLLSIQRFTTDFNEGNNELKK